MRRLREFFPWPLVGMALLMVVLIVLTPLLISSGQPPAGTIFTQAELIVDRVANANTTHFYVRALGTTVRYAGIHLGIASGFSWTGGGFPSATLNWTTWLNETNVLSLNLPTTANPVAVNVSVLYSTTNGGGSALYVGLFVFYVGPGPGSPSVATLFVATATPGIAVGSTNPVSGLPLVIPLANLGPGVLP